MLTWRGLVTYYILLFIEIGTRRVCLGGITRHPDAGWMEQVARNASMQDSGYLHDRDQKFCREFRETLAAGARDVAAFTSQKSDSERRGGTLGTFDQRGMPVAPAPAGVSGCRALSVWPQELLSPMSIPSLRSSPWMRALPKAGCRGSSGESGSAFPGRLPPQAQNFPVPPLVLAGSSGRSCACAGLPNR